MPTTDALEPGEYRIVSAQVPAEIRSELELRAKLEDRSLSWLVRQALQRYVNKEADNA
jgi:predicted transcriptional regulator